MKKIFAILTVLAAMVACSKDDADNGGSDTPVAPTSITVSPDPLTAERNGGSVTLTVTAPSRPKVTTTADWVTVTDGTYKDYKITFTLTVNPYGEYGSRETTLTVTAGSLSKNVSLTQQGREKPNTDTDIAKTLVTSGATTQAQALYDFLLANYGKKVLSGIIADVNWNHKEADKIYAATGKYPALNCYDFIHILYSGANWINYSDLTPVTEWADAGGIVALMWHFNVPKSQGADTSDVTCTPSETTFRAANVFTEGSWENQWFYDQMDKVVDVILALQEKGIAAIWRPFHEAAGNATAINQASWTKAWFWWGYDGAEVQKRLWTTMYDYFYAKGIRNLIWVWTTQNYNGNAGAYYQDKDWYPGDQYVDIVGRDLYGYNASQNAQEFTEIQATYPHKMVTLAECGKNGDTPFAPIPDAWTAGAAWSWFMPWYGSSMPDNNWWKTAFASDFVLTREDISL